MFEAGSRAAKLAQAHVLLSEVAAAITSDVPGPAAAEELAEVLALRNHAELVTCQLAERVDRSGYFAADNAASRAGWLRTAAHASHHWASARVLVGRAIADQLPATKDTWQHGRLTFEHADVIRRAVDGQTADMTAVLDRALAAAAADCSPTDLRDIAHRLLEEFAPDEQDQRRERDAGKVGAHLSDLPDGGRLDANLDHEGTAILRAALDKYLPRRDPDQPLTPAQRRAHALVEMARQSLDYGDKHPAASNKPHLVLSLSAEQLRQQTGVAYTPGHGTLPLPVVRRLACDAHIIPLVLGGDGLPLDIGRKTRTIPTWMRIALNERDEGCTAPGCDRPPSWTDAHHVWHWADGGPTTLDNCTLLCRRHHTMVHQGKLTITALGNQQFRYLNTTPTASGRLRT